VRTNTRFVLISAAGLIVAACSGKKTAMSDDLKKEPQYHSAVPRMFLGLKHTLGPLKSAEEPQGSAGYNWGSDAPVQGAYGDYLIRVRFERGEAEVRLIVVRERGAWKVRGFNVGAPVPLRPRNDVQPTAA